MAYANFSGSTPCFKAFRSILTLIKGNYKYVLQTSPTSVEASRSCNQANIPVAFFSSLQKAGQPRAVEEYAPEGYDRTLSSKACTSLTTSARYPTTTPVTFLRKRIA